MNWGPIYKYELLFKAEILLIIILAIQGCGGRETLTPVQFYPSGCRLLSGPEETADSITVALPGMVSPSNAPRAENSSEEIVFGYLYHTLFTIDCRGDIRPVLADRWRTADNGNGWIFHLKEGIGFRDGSRITADDVISSWNRTAGPRIREIAGIDSFSSHGQYGVRVYLSLPRRNFPRILATSTFAVAKRQGQSQWPAGSGPYLIAEKGSSSRRIIIRPWGDSRKPVIRFLTASAERALDLLGGTADVTVTSDPVVIDYASGHSPLITVPLPWNRTYLFLSTSRVRRLRMGGDAGRLKLFHRQKLARDAVRGESRGCLPHFWLDNPGDCPALTRPIPHLPRYRGRKPRRILYHRNDPAAADLAGRLVALAAADTTLSEQAAAFASAVPGMAGGEAPVKAEGVSMELLDSSLRYGRDFGYVIAVAARPVDPCTEALDLISRARWLAPSQIDPGEAVIPLVDTRSRVIIRRDRVPLATDWIGRIFLTTGSREER